ncbi:MAG: oligoribonuclease [Gammaproteobacteria bacterium]|nr:oligoribonuclease [Gammaproteobacteria bacterium]MCP4476204.1 oligoribonuclease [Gammaproteobacteria bacterium]
MNEERQNRLIWLDLEMTGLDFDNERIIEIAIIITDRRLDIVAESQSLTIKQSDELLAAMDNWNTKQHTKSGLVERVKASTISEAIAENRMLDFISQHVDKGVSPMCGNSICTDRRFLYKYMPKLEEYFHYRHIDISTIKELGRRWYGEEAVKGFKKRNRHLALEDIKDSIEELKYYRRELFK